LIVGTLVTNAAPDARHLIPVLDRVQEFTGATPRKVLADTGYRSEENFERLRARSIDGYVAVGREGKAPHRTELGETRLMQRKLATKRGRATYKQRKHIAEPPFAWIKSVLGFRTFSLRGLDKVRAEWDVVCTALNLRRLAPRIGWR